MKKTIRKILCLALSTSVVLSCVTATAFAADNTVGVTYSAHVQNIGWMAGASNGQTAGTTGQALRVEALKIALTGSNLPANAGIAYQVHVQDKGWVTPASQNGSVAGTVGESKRIEAIAIALSNMPGYSVEYRVHVQNIGWMNWTKDGNITGTTGKGLRIEAIEIKVVSNIAVNSISVTPALQLVAGGNNGTITAAIDPSSVSADSINWSSNNTAVATVSKGIVTPVSGGSATITASVGGKSAACIVTVSAGGGYAAPVAVTGLSVSPTVTSLFAGGPTSTIIPAILPVDATNKSITWSSDNTNVATVAGGVITPVSAGTATITATSADNTKLSATTEVTVTATPTVYTLADLTAAIQSTGVTSITLGGNIAGNAVAAHTGTTNFVINFGSYALTGNLNITANSVTAITFNGDAGNRIIGNLTITAPLASVTNNVAITGSATLNGVALHSYIANETHGGGIIMNGQGRLNLSGDASGSAITIDTSAPVTLAGTISGMVTISAPGAQVTVEGTAGSMILSSTALGSDITVAGTGSLTSFTANTSGTLTTEAGGTVTGTATGTGVTETTPSAGVKVFTTALSSIAIKTPASKTIYAVGETLDITGLTIEGTYSDGSKKDEVITAANVTGFSSSAIATDQVLTVTVDGKTVTYKVQIAATLTAFDFTYTVASGKATITGYTGTGTTVVIPSTLGGYPVTSIGDDAFAEYGMYNGPQITTVSLPQGLTSIGSYAFFGCIGLTGITLPSSLTSIGEGAFEFCTLLADVTLPSSVTSVGTDAFGGCSGLTQISVASSNVNYSSNDGVLFNKDQTKLIAYPAAKTGSYIIPSTVTGIGDDAFAYCFTLTNVTLPSSVTSIGTSAFEGCSGLTQINVDPGNEQYSSIDGVLFNKDQTTLLKYPVGKTGSYIIPSTVTAVDNGAFSNCNYLLGITIPNGMLSIGIGAFEYSALTGVTLPSSVTSIGAGAFNNCYALSCVRLNSATTTIYDDADTIPSTTKIIGFDPSTAKNYATKYGNTFINIVPSESDYAYTVASGNATITGYSGPGGDVVIPSTLGGYSVTSIGDEAFENCAEITSISIPLGVVSIGNYAFYRCANLNSTSIPNSVINIGYEAFNGTAISVVEIPSSVTDIGYSAFAGKSFTQINVNNNNTAYSSINGVLFDKSVHTLIQYPIGNTASTYAIPNSVTSIDAGPFGGAHGGHVFGAFMSATHLASITIPASVTSMDNATFFECSELTQITVDNSNTAYCSVNGVLFSKSMQGLIQYPIGNTATTYAIPNTVTHIGSGSFRGCKSLTNITIPNGVTEIGSEILSGWGYGTFAGCTGLTSVTIPGSVTIIDDYAFANCSNLTSATFLSGATSIGSEMFSGCGKLATVVISNTVESIGWYAFDGCSSLKSISIPDSVATIGVGAFRRTGLTSVTIPRNVTEIEDSVFDYCSGLTQINVDPSNAQFSSLNGVLFNKDKTTLLAYPNALTGSYIIPATVTSIEKGAFAGNEGLTGVTIPSGVLSVGSWAFANCTTLATIRFNSATTTIDDSAYTIPSTTKIIGYSTSTAKDYATKYSRTFEVIS